MASSLPDPVDALRLHGPYPQALAHVDQSTDLDSTERRTLRARMQPMAVVPQTDPTGDCIGLYTVYSASGADYIVDLVERACECPDAQHTQHPHGCKHYRRVVLALDETPLPRPTDSAAGYWPWLDEILTFVTGDYARGVTKDVYEAALDARQTAHSEQKGEVVSHTA